MRITNSLFFNNTAQNPTFGYGGAIWVGSLADVAISGDGFINNVAHLGGAIYVSPNGQLSLTERPDRGYIELNANRATESGGAIYNQAGAVDVNQAQFNANRVPLNALFTYGGAIASLGTLTVTRSSFIGNEGRYGGAVFVGGQVTNARGDRAHEFLSEHGGASWRWTLHQC